jgi:methionine sulfoxide reductase heme-binding subunit
MTEALWYLGRGTGVTSLVLLTVVVALGIASRSGRSAFGLPRFAVAAIHRNASLLALGLLAIHVVSLLFDPYAQLRLVDVVLPFTGAYRPLWLGLGTLAFDVILALVATSLLRDRLGVVAWRVVHWTAYLAWPAAFLHGLFTGTDSGQLWLRVVAAGCALVVLASVGWRVSGGFADTADARLARASPQTVHKGQMARGENSRT